MSESKQNRATLKTPSRRSRFIGNRWFVVSVALHVILAVALIYLTPIREIIEQATREQPELTMSSSQLQEVSSRILDINELEVRSRVFELSTALEMMDTIEAMREEDFGVFEDEQKSRAAEDARVAMESAAEHLQAAQEALREDDPGAANNAQQQASFAQEEAAQRLALIENGAASQLLEKQQAAAAKTEQAIEAQTAYRHKRHTASGIERDIDRDERDLKNAEYHLKRAQEELEKRQKRVQEREDELAKIRKQAEEDGKDRSNQLKRVESHRDRERQNVAEAQTKVEQEQEDLKKAQEALKQSQAKLEEAAKDRDARQQQAIPANEAALAAQRDALAAMNEQLPAPQDAAAADETAAATSPEAPAPEATEQAEPAPAVSPTNPMAHQPLGEHRASYSALSGKDIPDLYEHARQLEQKVTESYKRIRAMELAQLRDVTLDQALQNTDVVQPMRSEVDAELIRGEARSQAKLEAQKEEVAKTIRETQSMVELAEMLLMQLQEHGEQHGGSQQMTLKIIREQQEELKEMEEQASQDVSGQVVDLTDPEVLIPAPQIPDEVRPMPGRKFGAGGMQPADWVFVDSWYIIGPFENPGRANINRKFPPETAVDLDAAYIGKNDQVIRWEFVQSGEETGMVQPSNAEPYGIWYAYTELKFDEPTETWIAMGSDDRGTLWINGEPVWISPESHKPWRVGEALRRVAFPAGRSQVLFRVENGWRDMGFSLLIHAGSAQVAANE